MKTIYLLYISAGVALATIYYLYKSHKETMSKINLIQNLVSSIQQVPVMKYNDVEIQTTIKTRCDDLEELIHFVNDDINNKLEKTINLLDNKQSNSKQNTTKTNIPKTFFSEFIGTNEQNDNNNLSNSFEKLNNKNKDKDKNSTSNSYLSQNLNENAINLQLDEDNNETEGVFKKYQNEQILNIENFRGTDFREDDLSGSLSSLNKAALDIDSVHYSSPKTDRNIADELNYDNNEDLNETYDKINLESKLSNNLDNKTNKSISNNIKEDEQTINSSINHSVSDNSKMPKLQELKQIAKSRDLSTNGNKKEIIQRLLDNGYIF